MILERRGLPTVTFCTTVFEPLARSAASAAGLPDLPLVIVPHPIKDLTVDQVLAHIDASFPHLLHGLYATPTIEDGGSEDRPDPDPSLLRSEPRLIEVPSSLDAVTEVFHARGFSDGLPIVPPTLERVTAMLAAAGLRGDEPVEPVPPDLRVVTTQDVAVNAVMAGCRPTYLSAVLASLDALASEGFNLDAVQATTNPGGPLLIFNGPAVERLDINVGAGALGPGRRANATIGRAIRLVLMNLGGARPGVTDLSTQGYPGKYTFCVGENQAESPWEPLHVERGFLPEVSTVTVAAASATVNMQEAASSAAELLESMAASMRLPGSNEYLFGGHPTFLICPEHAHLLSRAGYTKTAVKAALYERTWMDMSGFSANNRHYIRRFRADELGEIADDARIPIARRPDDILIVVVGGAGTHSVHVMTHGYADPTTRAFEPPLPEVP